MNRIKCWILGHQWDIIEHSFREFMEWPLDALMIAHICGRCGLSTEHPYRTFMRRHLNQMIDNQELALNIPYKHD